MFLSLQPLRGDGQGLSDSRFKRLQHGRKRLCLRPIRERKSSHTIRVSRSVRHYFPILMASNNESNSGESAWAPLPIFTGCRQYLSRAAMFARLGTIPVSPSCRSLLCVRLCASASPPLSRNTPGLPPAASLLPAVHAIFISVLYHTFMMNPSTARASFVDELAGTCSGTVWGLYLGLATHGPTPE